MNKNHPLIVRLVTSAVIVFSAIHASASDSVSRLTGSLIPEPHSIVLLDGKKGVSPAEIKGFVLSGDIHVPAVAEKSIPKVFPRPCKGTIRLVVDGTVEDDEAYVLRIEDGRVEIRASDQKGLDYGTTTMLQLLQNASELSIPVPAMEIKDGPDSRYRAVHIDLKSHSVPYQYLYDIVDFLAMYKINGIVVEFEDKIEYRGHPDIAIPGAFTVEQWKNWSEYASRRNMDVSPLVQGLGHADFILKHDRYKHLREIPSSDWAFCPLDEEYYDLQFSLYDDAIDATPGGKYLHLGGDEVSEVGLCPECKASGKDGLELYLYWLGRVSDYVKSKGRIPVFWDDMLFKGVDLYMAILDLEDPAKQDSIWNARVENLNDRLKSFPEDVIYMRWQYENAMGKGTRTVLKWYNEQGLKVMGANAAQTAFAMLPLNDGQSGYIKSFHDVSREAELEGILCTAWDDASPLFDTYKKGFIAHAQYGWNHTDDMSTEELSRRYRIREFGNGIADLPDFRLPLESLMPLWQEGLVEEGVRGPMWETKGRYKMISMPTDIPGEWSRKYSDRLDMARANVCLSSLLGDLLEDYRNRALRNDYSLEAFSCINELAGYTASLLLAIEKYDISRTDENRRMLEDEIERFDGIRAHMEEVYSRTRSLSQPDGYILPMRHMSRLSLMTADTDWMYIYELELLADLKNLLNLS